MENNFFGIIQDLLDGSKKNAEVNCHLDGYCQTPDISDWQQDVYVAQATNQNLQKINEILEVQAEGAVLLATSAAALGTAGGSLVAGGTLLSGQGIMIGLGANGTYQVMTKPIEEFSVLSWGISGITGGLGSQGLIPVVIYSTTGSAFDAAANGEKLGPSMTGGSVGTVVGSAASKPLGPIGSAILSEALSDAIKNILKEHQEKGENK